MTSVKLSLREGNSVAKAVFHSTLGQWVIGENVWLPFCAFCTEHSLVTSFKLDFLEYSISRMLACDVSGFKLLVLLLPVFSLPITCKRRCFFCLWAIWLLQSFVWCSLRHLRHDQCCEISGFTEKSLTNFSINPIKEFLLQRFSFFSASRLSIICGNITCAPKKRWLSVTRRNGVVFNAKFWLFSSYEWRNCTRRESAWIVCYFRPFH